jgi:hypothetical protein
MLHQYRQNPVRLAQQLGVDSGKLLRWMMADGTLDKVSLDKLYDWCYVQDRGTSER